MQQKQQYQCGLQFGAGPALAVLNGIAQPWSTAPTRRNEQCGPEPSFASRFGQRDSNPDSGVSGALRRSKLNAFRAERVPQRSQKQNYVDFKLSWGVLSSRDKGDPGWLNFHR